nr:kinesin-like protein KIN-7I isoform X14 [Hydra vulgaris]
MDTTNIQVGIRIRPLIRREIQTNQTCYWNADNKRIYSTEKEYHFDEVFDSTSSTMNIYNILGKPLVENAMRGINGTLFAYGQTASGKTHTILGDVNELGILPLAIKEVFDHTVKQPDREFLLRASFIEIYNEEVTDLLASKKENIKILTNSENDVVVENLTTHTVISYESTMDLVQKGIINRKIGITNMNERSSRSHLIFRLVIESREILELNNSMEANGTIIAAELNVVDLAGSERAGQTGAQGIRLKESSFINTSLMSLGVVIRKLSEGDKSCHIPYRDSKLTRLLQKSLGGNARTCIICTVSPVVLEETQQTLLFASQAKEVKNRPTVNEVLDDKSMMRKQMNEINLLKRKIIELETGISHSEKDKILAEQISYQQKIEKQRERISLLLKEIVCTGRRSFQNVTKKDNMRRLTWCPGGLLKSGKNFNDIKSFDEDIEMDTLDGSFEKIEYQLLKQEFDEYKAQTCSPDEYIKLKDKLTALEIQHETTKNKLRDLIINQEPHEAVQTLREENSRLCNKNEVLSNDNAKLQAEIDISKAKINSLIDDVAMLQEQQESMVDKDYLERLKEVVNAKSLELEESRKKCELENEELIHALANQKKLWNEQVISLEEQKFNLEQELHAANKKIIHECKKSEDFQKELQLLKEQFSILKEENSKAKSQTEMFVDECNDLKLKSDLLISADEDIITKNLLDELELLKQHLSSLNEEKDIAVSEKEMLAKENNDLKLKFSQISCEEDIVKKNLSDELEQLKQHLSLLNEEKNTAVSENKALAKENNHLKFTQISSVEEDIVKKNLLDELELLKQHLSSLNKEKHIAVSEKEMLAKENNDLKLKFSQISFEEDIVKKNLTDELELLKQHLNSLKQEKDIAVSEKEMLAKENNDLKLKFSQISCEEDIVKKNLSDELELLKQHLNSLKEEKDIAVSEKEMFAKENNDLKLKFSQINCEEDIVKKNLSDELHFLKQHLNLLNEEKNTDSEKEMLIKENNNLKFGQISSVEEDILKKNLLDELELLKQQLNSLNEEKNAAVSEKEMLAEENNHLRLAQISSVEEDIVKKNLSDELCYLKQQLNSLNEQNNIAVSEKEMLAKANNDLRLAQFSSDQEDIVKKNLSDELQLTKQRLISINEERSITVSQNEMLFIENNDLKLKLQQFHTVEEEIMKKYSSALDELQILKQELNFVNQERNSVVSLNEMLVKENNDMKLRINHLTSIEEDIMQKNLSVLEELQLLKQKFDFVNDEKNISLSKNEMLIKDIDELKLKFNESKSMEQDLMKKNLSVSDELQSLKLQFNSANEERNIAVSVNEILTKENKELKLKVNQFSFIEEEIMKKNALVLDELNLLKQNLMSVNEERNNTVSENEMLVKKNKELKMKIDQLNSVEEKVFKDNLSDEMQRLKQHLNSIYEEKNNAENLNELLRQENDELKLKVKQYSCSINEFEMKIFDLTQSCDKNIFEQQKKINELIDINKELSIKSNQLSDEKNQISEELDLMTNKFSDIEHNFLVTQTKNHDLMEALKKEQENCAKQCKLSKSAYERKCDQIEAETQVLMNTLKALKAENIQIMEINKVLKSEILVAKENLECQQNEQITIIDKHEKHIKELQNDIALLNKKLETHDEVISKNNDLVQKVTSLEETKIELEQSLNKVNKALKESQLNSTEQSSQLTSVVHKENQPFNNSVNSLKYENLSKEELIDKINHVEHLLELKKKDISVYNDHRIEQNATIEQLKKKNEDLLSRLKRLEQILTDLRKPSGNASTREWEEHCISLERIKVRLESQVLHLEERKRVLKLQLERYQQENTHLNVLIKQKDEKFAKASKENEEEKEKLANAIQNLKIDNERVCTGLKDAFNRMNAAEKALTETKSVAELEISKRDSEIERVSNYLIRSYERYQHYKGIAKNCLENKCSAKIKPIQNDVFTMTESYFPVLSEKSTEQLSSQKRRSNEQLEGERQKSRKKLSNSIKECENEAECNQQ